MAEEQPGAYARAGVDIAAAHRAKALMQAAVQATYGPEVLAGMGAFGGLYDAGALQRMSRPVLVASTDGVGTKTMVAARMGRWDTIGQDIVNHCLNDILVQGAQPLFFLDYVASSRLEPEKMAAVVQGVASACRAAGCALLGGETAEMPGVYRHEALDLVGTVVGIVERDRLLDGSRIEVGDIVLGFPSSGLHTNGYTLARNALAGLDWSEPHPELEAPPGEALLAPHRSYLDHVRRLWQAGVDIHGLAHITGGGLVDNPPRILPEGAGILLHRGAWPEPPLFGLIQHLADVSDGEMFHVFNMGLGMLAIVRPEHAALSLQALDGDCYGVGEVVAGSGVSIA